jgi:hypothetical protein
MIFTLVVHMAMRTQGQLRIFSHCRGYVQSLKKSGPFQIVHSEIIRLQQQQQHTQQDVSYLTVSFLSNSITCISFTIHNQGYRLLTMFHL